MPNDLNPPNLFNPMMLWTDLGMRALEMTVSSTQNIGEGLDRLTRAGATPQDSPVVAESPVARAAADTPAMAAGPGLALVAQMQRTTFDLMTQAWRQWMNTFSMLATMGSGRSFGEALARQAPQLKAMQDSLQIGTAGRTGAQQTPARSERQQGGRQRERAGHHDMEHAFGAAETKRRGSRAKPKTRSRNH